MEEIIIISLGGSLIVPDEIDAEFLKSFKEIILAQVAKPARNADSIASAGGGKKFIIITGGGKLCRRYQEAAQELSSPTSDDLDWIGIASLRLNAQLLRVIFEDKTDNRIIKNFSESFEFNKPVIIGSAYKPGHSTDWDAVLAAKNVGAKKIINLSNTDYVYDSDPKKNPAAKKLEKISWPQYRALIPGEWTPGLNSPFDPTASKMAEELGIEVIIMNGKPIENFKKYLNGEEFLGTTIK
jgi:uridylate kinase